MQLAFDLYDDLAPDTVIHELTHSADYRFLGEGIWDEEAWNSMNPEGFSYYEAYIDENGESYETAGSPDHTAMDGWPADEVYFIDPYSKTYAMEDRARLMENLSLRGKKHWRAPLPQIRREWIGPPSCAAVAQDGGPLCPPMYYPIFSIAWDTESTIWSDASLRGSGAVGKVNPTSAASMSGRSL